MNPIVSSQRLAVTPGPPLTGAFQPPGDKSITHRAYLLGLLQAGSLEIVGANPGADCAATRRCIRALGAHADGGTVVGPGGAWNEPDDVLDCGNSGTTLRLLCGMLAAQPFLSLLSGDASLRRRPVDRILNPLARMGAQVSARSQGRFPPVAIHGRPLHAIEYALPVSSAQIASSLLLAGLFARGRTTIEVPGPARDHTERMLMDAGVPLELEPRAGGGRRVSVVGPISIAPADRVIQVPGDFSAAAFFLAGAAARSGACVTARNVNLNSTRIGLLDVLEQMGARVERANIRIQAGEEIADVTVTGPEVLHGFDVPPDWLPRLIDEVPAWTIAATAARGRSRVGGASELRLKESDRIAVLASQLARLGVRVQETPDGIEIEGGPVAGGTVHAEDDHRIAMAFAVLGTFARAPVTIDGAAHIVTSYPDFGVTLAELGGKVLQEAGGIDRNSFRREDAPAGGSAIPGGETVRS